MCYLTCLLPLVSLLHKTIPSVLSDHCSSVGLAVFLVFGTQKDTLRVWCFWRRTPLMPVKIAPHEVSTLQIDVAPRLGYTKSLSGNSMLSSTSTLKVERERKSEPYIV